LSAGGCTTRPSIVDLKRETTQAALPVNGMVRLRPMSDAWCWRSHFPIGWWVKQADHPIETTL
jgi:hypothetical protein